MMSWADAGGVALRYELSGQGAHTVVLVHEMGGTLESWDLVVPELQRTYRTLRFDTRGAGLSEKIRGSVTVDQLADDLRALLDTLDLAAPVAVVGCAVGGAVAINFAARYPERTAKLIVTSPSTGVMPARRQASLEQIARFESEGPRGAETAAMDSSYPKAIRERDPALFSATRLRWLANDPESFAALNRMLVQLDLSEAFPRIKAPTLVVGCTLDVVRPPKVVSEIATRIPDARFVTVEAGHFSAIHNPGGLLAEFLPFLAKWPGGEV
jgi:3-oxoadipate enol-lactonase